MKFFAIIGAAIVCFSATALAAWDMTYMTHANAGETKELPLSIPSGKSQVDVWSADGNTISCTFVDRGTGNVAYEAKNVQRCVGTADLALPATAKAQITNNGTKETEIRVWVRTVK
jgi:hypothetical protein